MDAVDKLLKIKFKKKQIVVIYAIILAFPALMQLDLVVFGNKTVGIAQANEKIKMRSNGIYGRRTVENITTTPIHFEVENGDIWETYSGMYKTYEPGEEVTVYYAASDPENCITLSINDFYLNKVGAITFGVFFMFSMLMLVQNAGDGPKPVGAKSNKARRANPRAGVQRPNQPKRIQRR